MIDSSIVRDRRGILIMLALLMKQVIHCVMQINNPLFSRSWIWYEAVNITNLYTPLLLENNTVYTETALFSFPV